MRGSQPSRRLKTTPFDPAEYLDDEQMVVACLNEVLAEGDPSAVIAQEVIACHDGPMNGP